MINPRVHGIKPDGVTPKSIVKDNEQITVVKYVIGRTNNPALLDWLKHNLNVPNMTQAQWSIYVQRWARVRYSDGSNTGGVFSPHTDYQSCAALMYFWDTGGDNVITSWYKHEDNPLVHESKSDPFKPVPATQGGAYSKLTKLESVQAIPNQWYLYCGSVIHDVQNITGVRKYVSIAVPTIEDLDRLGLPQFDLS